MPPKQELPAFLAPMLARSGEPFDSEEFHFEVKWDGTRALAFVDGSGLRLLNRRRLALAERYPELGFLRQLPPGTVLDGEIIVLRGGKPDFALLLSREQTRDPLKQRSAAKVHPATFVVFDQLYDRFHSLLKEPLEARRERLEKLTRGVSEPLLAFSSGVLGRGQAFFKEARRRGLEGVMAKRLGSPYRPGQRSGDWIKIKARQLLYCAIIGFVPAGKGDLKSLILAAAEAKGLRFVGKVGSGISDEMRARLLKELSARRRPRPIIPCAIRGQWVEPGLYCKVNYLEFTASGHLRAPVFKELVVT